MAAVALAVGLGALVATDAGRSSQYAWEATALAALLIAVAVAVRSCTPTHAAMALLGVILLLRHDLRLLLAPVYGAGLIVVEGLAARSMELAGVAAIGRGVVSARVAADGALAAAGGGVAAVAALAVTIAPGRSVALTAAGALVTVLAVAVVVRHARRRYPVVSPDGLDDRPAGRPHGASDRPDGASDLHDRSSPRRSAADR